MKLLAFNQKNLGQYQVGEHNGAFAYLGLKHHPYKMKILGSMPRSSTKLDISIKVMQLTVNQ